MADFYSVEVTLSPWIPKHILFPLQVGFEASNFTQVPLQQPVHIRDSNHTHCLMSLQ